MTGDNWITEITEEAMQGYFPRKVKTIEVVPEDLKPNAVYKALGVGKFGDEWLFKVIVNDTEMWLGSEYFEIVSML